MSKLIQQLIDAYLNGEKDLQFYLDRRTFEVFVPLEDELLEESYVSAIPYKTSKELYEIMFEFSRLQPKEVEGKLFLSLNNRKPLKNF